MGNRAGYVLSGVFFLTAGAGALFAQTPAAAPAARAGAPRPAPLAVGSGAPSVSLLLRGKMMLLQHLLAGNRNLILFFPKKCTSCDTELQVLDKKAITELDREGVAVFAVSPDEPQDQADTANRLSLPYVMAGDPGGKAARAFHVEGTVAIFLLDNDGIVRYVADLGQSPVTGSDLLAAAKKTRRPSKR
jgi:peroxiredoxin